MTTCVFQGSNSVPGLLLVWKGRTTPSSGIDLPFAELQVTDELAKPQYLEQTYLLDKPTNLATDPLLAVKWIGHEVLAKMLLQTWIVTLITDDAVALAAATFCENVYPPDN